MNKSSIVVDGIKIYPYYDLIFVCGIIGSGKSELVKKIVSKTPRYMVFDPNREYKPSKFPEAKYINIVEQAEPKWYERKDDYDKIIFQPVNSSYDEFEDFCDYVRATRSNSLIVVEEIGRYELARKSKESAVKSIVDSGRHRNLGFICTARRPNDAPYYLRSSFTKIFAFQLHSVDDVKAIDSLILYPYAEKLREYSFTNKERYIHCFVYYDELQSICDIRAPIKI